MYHTTSSATDMVPEGHSCRGLVPLCKKQMDISAIGDERLNGATASKEPLADDRKQNRRMSSGSDLPVAMAFLRFLQHNLLLKIKQIQILSNRFHQADSSGR